MLSKYSIAKESAIGYSLDMLKYVALCMGEGTSTIVEMILKTVKERPLSPSFGLIVTGDSNIFKRTSDDLNIPLSFDKYVKNEEELKKARADKAQYIFYETSAIDVSDFKYGVPAKETGYASYESVKASVDIICNSLALTLVTPSVSSISLGLAGYKENSISDLLSSFAESSRLTNMYRFKNANVFLLTYYGSVKEALSNVSEEKIMDAIIRIESLFVSNFFDSSKPIAVAALNPDLGDGEFFGSEEAEIIKPVIRKAEILGINAIGPVPVRDVYRRAERGDYSAVLVYFRNELDSVTLDKNAVIITWGLPFLRVGITTGLELEKAGKGIADNKNLIKALKLAIEFSKKHVFA